MDNHFAAVMLDLLGCQTRAGRYGLETDDADAYMPSPLTSYKRVDVIKADGSVYSTHQSRDALVQMSRRDEA